MKIVDFAESVKLKTKYGILDHFFLLSGKAANIEKYIENMYTVSIEFSINLPVFFFLSRIWLATLLAIYSVVDSERFRSVYETNLDQVLNDY